MREREHLRLRYRAIASFVGPILVAAGVVMMLPLLILPSHPEEVLRAPAFVVPAAGLIVVGGLCHRGIRRPAGIVLSIQEGGIIVVITWIVVILVSALPFVWLSGLTFSRAVFEAVSGWTTTGLSVVDVNTAGPLILLWRSVMQLAGGAGFAIIMMSSILGPTGVGFATAEGRSDQLVPHVRASARLVLAIYSVYAVAGVLAYRLAGMSSFDAVNHAFAAISTGGFSTRAQSIGYWDSVAVEAVTLPLMILGNLSFVTAWFLVRAKLRSVARNGEVRLLAIVVPLAAAMMFFLTCRTIYPQLGKSIRVAVFETVTALTTTGFSTVSYADWNASGILLMIALMLIGGGTCSTAGGIKQFRVHLLASTLVWDLKRALMPRTAVVARPVWEGDQRVFVDDARVRQVSTFVSLYLMSFVVGTMVLCACGYSLGESLFEFASALGTVGLSVGVTSPNMPDVALWVEAVGMFLGRLEFMVVIVSALKLAKDMRRAMARESHGS